MTAPKSSPALKKNREKSKLIPLETKQSKAHYLFEVMTCAFTLTRPLYNAVNLKAGYGMIDIRTPREVLDAEGL
jgi:hypothetical protein